MKSVVLVFTVFFAMNLCAQSTHNIDFEPGGTGADWTWIMTENADNPPLEFVANPNASGINTSATVAQFIVRQGGNPWALTFTDDDGEFTFDADNAIVKIMVHKPNISNIGFKVEGFSDPLELVVANTITDEWEEITFDFSSVIGNTYNRIVVIPDFDFDPRPGDRMVYLDNLQVPDGALLPPPAEPADAPPAPLHDAENVLSIYSEAYTNLAGTDFNPWWGQSTTVTVDYNVAGNNTLRYQNLNYQGTQLAGGQDVSGYKYIHVDFWTPNATALNFYVISPDNETPYALPIETETWVSIDIELSDYVPPVNLADVFQFKVDGNGTVFFDNWYFWKEPYNPLTDATLSDLLVDGVTLDGFSPTSLSYDVELPIGTVDVPVLTAITAVEGAEAVVNPAIALPGTTEVVVTALDGETQQSYSVNFTVAEETPTSEYCETEVFHLGIPAEIASAAYLIIENIGANTVFVEIESATDDPVDLLIVTGESGAQISDEDFSVPGKISRTMTWPDTPPSDVLLNVLWSKETMPGNWQLSPDAITVPFAAVCEPAGPTMVTFSVDMSEYDGSFNNVYVSGNFNSWSGEANQMLDPDMDDIYETSIELENGTYEYKFTLDGWLQQEMFSGGEFCTVTNAEFTNRFVEISQTTEIPTVCWNSCYACPKYKAGWHGISSNVIPENPALDEVFAPVLDDMTIMLSNNGIFWPTYNINTIGDWDAYKGYKVKFANGTNYDFSGTPLEDRTVSFEPGISYLPVLSEGPASVNDVVVPLGAAIDFMFDLTNGLIYWPNGGILPENPLGLDILNPGFAYLTKFNQTATVDFGDPLQKSASIGKPFIQQSAPAFWNEVLSTGIQHIISIQANELIAGDFVGVFDANGTCAGYAYYNGNSDVLPLVVYGNDLTTEAKDGMAEMEEMTFVILRDGKELNVVAEYDQTIAMHDGTFAENGLSIVIGLKAGTTGISANHPAEFNIYPNPAKGIFNIAPREEGNFDITISNITGQIIYNTKINGTSKIKLAGQPKGIYFVRLTNNTSLMVKKVVIE